MPDTNVLCITPGTPQITMIRERLGEDAVLPVNFFARMAEVVGS